MAVTEPTKSVAGSLPPGYALVPISAAQKAASLRVCAVVKRERDPVGGHLVQLRATVEANVFLGAVADIAGHVHRWVELWVQSVENLSHTPTAVRERLSNR